MPAALLGNAVGQLFLRGQGHRELNGIVRNGVFSVPLQSVLGMIQMLEDTLIEHAHTKPLLPSQLIRYREVQVPDGRYRAHAHAHTQVRPPPAPNAALPCSRKDWIKLNILPPQEEHNKWRLTSLGRSHKHLLFSLKDQREPEHLRGLLIALGNSKQ